MKYRVKPMYTLKPTGEPDLVWHVQRKEWFVKWQTIDVYNRESTAKAAVALLERQDDER